MSDWLYKATFVGVLVYLVLVGVLARCLRDHHHEVWEEHGSFLVIWNNSIKSGLGFLGLIFSRRSRDLADRKLTVLLFTVRGLLAACLIGMLSVWGMFSR